MTPEPPVVGPATFTLTLADSAGQPLAGAAVALEANMTHPGMQPVLTRAVEQEPGRYAADLSFTMGGDWFILVEVTLLDGRTLHRQVEVRGVRSL